MINWTEEDVEFICKNLLAPMSEELVKVFNSRDKLESEALDKVFSVVTDQLKEIKYEQERDRRFYKVMFTQVFDKNARAYDDFYKSWCEEFDKLNKEKYFND